MINPTNILTVLKYDGVRFFNVSSQASDPLMDNFTIDMTSVNAIYAGYEKPINALYLYLGTIKNEVSSNLILEYYNGTSWVTLTAIDQTQALYKSGIINWTTPLDSVQTEVNSITKHWVRITSETDLSIGVEVGYVGVLFSDDTDIGLEYPSLLKDCFYPQGRTDFIIYHASAKNYIISELLRKGYCKTVGGVTEPINQWDVLNVYELQQASLYYAMSQIFFNLSDNSSDNYWQKYIEYKSKFESAFNLGLLRIDQDNDGQADPEEKTPIKSYRWVR